MKLSPSLPLAALLFAPAAAAGQPVPERIEFNRDVRPILSDKCFNCHGPDDASRKARLRLDDAAAATKDRGGYHVIAPGRPADSELLARVTSRRPAEVMPPPKTGKVVTPREAAILRRWIEQGAEFQPHWSFVPPRRPALPAVKDAAWARGAIDRFVLAKIEAAGLKPSPEADKITLLRRLWFDLVGLPPPPAAVDAFLADTAPDAYERTVEGLLRSPHHGERLAMYWLDLVRYADTVGYHGDQEHHASPYRDWVIKAFNDNLPFDRFTVEQLAGDLLPKPTVDQKIATCYNRILQTTHEGGAQDKEYLAKYAADRVRNLSAVWMGATVGCAECHNHKYDPYTQKDFYRLAAFFADINERGAFKGPDQTPTKRPPEIEVVSPLDRAEAEALAARSDKLRAFLALLDTQPDEGGRLREKVNAALARLDKDRDAALRRKRLVMVTESVKPRPVRVLNRGDWLDTTGEIVGPAVPEFMKQPNGKGRPTRLDLARWLTAPDHPQTSRVFVNRLWHLFFGEGLCRSLEDIGAQGEWPTHPELLDWLAVEFVEKGWDVRHVIRLIVTSSAYRQSSLVSPALRERDLENRLFARQGRFRLPAEMVRDNALALSGLLVDRLGGRPVKPYQPEGYYVHLNFPKRTYKHDTDADQYRRGVYMHWQRQFLHPMLRNFDAPSREECTAQRPSSNTPLASLTLLNDPTFVEAARVLAARILSEGGKVEDERVRWAWRAVLSRPPQEREADVLLRLYRQERQTYGADRAAARKLLSVGMAPRPQGVDEAELAAWTSVARTLLNLNEAITRN